MTTPTTRRDHLITAHHRVVDTLLFDTMGTVVDVDGWIQERLAVILDRYGRTDAERIAEEWDRHIRAGMDDINNS
ncbi:MAG: hypothetical protein H7201_15930 [Candidatus Saccharibacteria bacterium]|nr:hypothetical protein [Microbacteriaceae bacterium]